MFEFPEDYAILDFKIKVDPIGIEKVRQMYAPPDHDVFLLVPPDFEIAILDIYAKLNSPIVDRDSCWDVYLQLLNRLKELDQLNNVRGRRAPWARDHARDPLHPLCRPVPAHLSITQPPPPPPILISIHANIRPFPSSPGHLPRIPASGLAKPDSLHQGVLLPLVPDALALICTTPLPSWALVLASNVSTGRPGTGLAAGLLQCGLPLLVSQELAITGPSEPLTILSGFVIIYLSSAICDTWAHGSLNRSLRIPLCAQVSSIPPLYLIVSKDPPLCSDSCEVVVCCVLSSFGLAGVALTNNIDQSADARWGHVLTQPVDKNIPLLPNLQELQGGEGVVGEGAYYMGGVNNGDGLGMFHYLGTLLFTDSSPFGGPEHHARLNAMINDIEPEVYPMPNSQLPDDAHALYAWFSDKEDSQDFNDHW
ncbi:unnamed protein product [Mycena citricolor]|uniref:Uncharacterized protein n=1 Tax=Mycena citricolor TaxID=2018698 RepID=A0AAD2K3I3_9AGAR|nr:unnamed protein product [Mycena citricolor]CAK5276927.1 unnamed protein product [Mycena citricolor]CAK5283571.1 unnamed protein product [Mycena citricolor]